MDDQIKEEWAGGACGMYEGDKKCTDAFGGETRKGHLDIDRRIIVPWI